MNSSQHPRHPGEEVLLRLLDDDLAPAEGRQISGHLEGCGDCRRQLDEVRESLNDYIKFHELVLKPALPPPPKPWARLDLRVAARDSNRRSWASWFWLGPRQWAAMAASIAVLFLVVRWFQQTPSVKAAELLRKAVSAEKAVHAPSRGIRLQSRKYKLDRPAHLPQRQAISEASPDAEGIRKMLESAGYSWEDPLSADAFARWHEQLPQKTDEVSTPSDQVYVIRTTTNASAISDASLQLRAGDLRAVGCTLRFGDADTLEMTEIPEERPAAPRPAEFAPAVGAAPALQPEPGSIPAAPAGPGDELSVIAALHRVGADLSESIEVQREGAHVLVNVTGVGPQRQAELQSALAGLATVRLKFGQFERQEGREVERRPAPQVDTANPLVAELQAPSPGAASTAELADQLIEPSDKIIERVYALRSLARRFPAETTAQMTASENITLQGIVRDHAAVVIKSTAGVRRVLAAILPQPGPVPASAEKTWQDTAANLLADARLLDQALNAGSPADDAARRKLRAAQALANLEHRLAGLEALLRQ